MKNKIRNLAIEFKKIDNAHILYTYNETEKYIENLLTYILAGIEQGDSVLIIENDRIYPLLHKKINSCLGEEELNKVHRINNFDFFCLQGNFNPSTVVNYFSKRLKPYTKGKVSLRTWAHVEWREEKDILSTIATYEEIDKVVKEMNLLAVYAYDTNRMTDNFMNVLLNCHNIHMTDNNILYLND